jgi:hypothetical protein
VEEEEGEGKGGGEGGGRGGQEYLRETVEVTGGLLEDAFVRKSQGLRKEVVIPTPT